jgi:hypothetical protein
MKGLKMNTHVRIVLMLVLCAFLTDGTTAEKSTGVVGNTRGHDMTIVLTKLEVSEKALLLCFDIRGNSEKDVWYCDTVNVFAEPPFEVFLDEDGQTLLLRRRLDVPAERTLYAAPPGKYVRLAPGETHHQAVSLDLPVRARRLFSGGQIHGIQYPTRLALEVGFYAGDLPGMVRTILSDAQRLRSNDASISECNEAIVQSYFGGFLVERHLGGLRGFSERNQGSDLSREVIIPYTFRDLKGERCAKLVVDGISIPYDEAD